MCAFFFFLIKKDFSAEKAQNEMHIFLYIGKPAARPSLASPGDRRADIMEEVVPQNDALGGRVLRFGMNRMSRMNHQRVIRRVKMQFK